MRKLLFVVAALVASPVFGVTSLGDMGSAHGPTVDMLYPEIAVDDDGWRGLLPVILINTDALADEPQSDADSAEHSERAD